MAMAVVAALLSGEAAAHGWTPAPDGGSGIAIAGVTHGDMRSLVRFRGDIARLADRQLRTDEPFRRLLNHANIQYAACAWGLVPGSIADEASPFNECAHAYLAAYRAVLDRMAAMAPAPEAAIRLKTAIGTAIRTDPDGGALCEFSVEPFRTGAVVAPSWGTLAAWLPARLLAATAALALLALALGRRERSRRGG